MASCGVVWDQPVMTEEERTTFASILLEYEPDLNVMDDLLQSSPLGWAARWGKMDLVKLYLELGVDPTLAGAPWATPLMWAKKKGFGDIAKLIRRFL